MDKIERLNELNRLFDQGLITQDELNKEKSTLKNESETDSHTLESIENKSTTTNKNTMDSRKVVWIASILAIVLLVVAYVFTDGFKFLRLDNGSKNPSPFVNVYFQEDEIFPVYLFYLKNTKQGLMGLTISSPAIVNDTVKVTYGFTEFGGLESKNVRVNAGSVKVIQITPYSPKLMEVTSPVNVTLLVKVTDKQNKQLFTKSWSLKVNPSDEIPWKIKNKDYTNLIASWVTPKSESVEALIRKAKEKTGSNFVPVDKMKDEDFIELVKVLFNSVKEERITYINSKIDEGYAQRIRIPDVTIKTKLANSLDGSVLLASLFENVGLRAYIVLLSDHAIVAVARPTKETEKIYIETTLLGRSTIESILSFETTFTAATKSGKEAYNKAYSKSVSQESGRFSVIDIHKARQEGVLPMK